MIKKIVWILPFCSFLAGYYILHLLFRVNEFPMPTLVGMHIHEAIIALSEKSLNARILSEKEDADLPHGTVISQRPAAGQKIKPYQSVFLVLAKKPALHKAPAFITKTQETIKQEAHKAHIHVTYVTLPSTYPTNTCIAQIPAAHEPLEHDSMLVYISAGDDKPIIWPDFSNRPLNEVQEFLQLHSLHADIHSDATYDDTAHVIAQYPVPGTIMNLDQLPKIQLQV